MISVGNITLGGTGKTPMVEWVARWYRRRGIRVTLISRGYGHAGGINDEGLVLEENLPDVPHLQDPDRVQLAAIAVLELETELIILDDGFQHRRLARDLDIVMLDALDPFGLGRLFPRGLLREPIGSLRRARAIVLSRADLLEPAAREAIRREVERYAPGVPFLESRHAPIDLIDGEGQEYPLERAGRQGGRGLLRHRQPRGIPPDRSSALPANPRPEGLPRPSFLHRGGRRLAGHLGSRPRGESRLDHPERFGQAPHRDAWSCSLARPAHRAGDHGRSPSPRGILGSLVPGS